MLAQVRSLDIDAVRRPGCDVLASGVARARAAAARSQDATASAGAGHHDHRVVPADGRDPKARAAKNSGEIDQAGV